MAFPHKLEGKILEDREYPCFSSAYYNAWSITETQCVIGKNKFDSILYLFLLLTLCIHLLLLSHTSLTRHETKQDPVGPSQVGELLSLEIS